MTAIPPERLEVIECPQCGAPPGQACTWKVRRPYGHVHLARVRAIDAEPRKAG